MPSEGKGHTFESCRVRQHLRVFAVSGPASRDGTLCASRMPPKLLGDTSINRQQKAKPHE